MKKFVRRISFKKSKKSQYFSRSGVLDFCGVHSVAKQTGKVLIRLFYRYRGKHEALYTFDIEGLCLAPLYSVLMNVYLRALCCFSFIYLCCLCYIWLVDLADVSVVALYIGANGLYAIL